MILKALADYYQRLVDDPNVDVAPYGFEDKPIPFLLVVDKHGKFLNVIDARTGEGRQKTARTFRVPQGEKKTSGIKANLLWDSPQYVFGEPKSDKSKDADRARDALVAFAGRLRADLGDLEDEGVSALLAFYAIGEHSRARAHVLLKEIVEQNANVTFVLDGDDGLIAQRPEVAARIAELYEHRRSAVQASSIGGEPDEIAVLHTAIKGVWGSQVSGANIVSFNDDAYCSHGRTKKDQGLNAPIGKHDEFAYTTALNYLLASERQRMQVGDASTVFWAATSCAFESDLHSFLAPKKGEEAVSYEKIRSLLAAVKTGIPQTEAAMPFHVLGLAPNASRIAVRFWYDGNVKELKERIALHFGDIEVVRTPHDPEFLSLFQLLVATALEHKSDNIPPNLGGDVARSVLTGAPYPRTLFANAVRRCKAEQKIDFARASIIKGFLVRNARLSKQEAKEVGVALDREYDNVGYVLGRLFAMLERIQEEAHRPVKLNRTIRDAYFSGAASSPQVVFKRLQDLSIHHLAKIKNSGKSTVWLEKEMGEITDLIPKEGAPASLALEDQGRFAIGYYHQRQDFFKKREATKTEEETIHE